MSQIQKWQILWHVHEHVELARTRHALGVLDFHQSNRTPAVAPVPLQSGLWPYVPSKYQAREPGATDLSCLLSGFAGLARLLSIINFLRTLISGKSPKEYAVSHTVVGHDLSRYRKPHFLKQNHVAGIIPTFTGVNADP